MSGVNPRRYWLCVLGALLVGYLPVLTAIFAIHNDYLLWFSNRRGWFLRFPEAGNLVALGRPVGAILLNLHFTLLHTLPDFLISRWFAFGLTLIAACLLADYLQCRLNVPPGMAGCASACVFLLPPSQLFVAWTTNVVPGTLNVCLTLLTYRFLDSGPEPTTAHLGSFVCNWRRLVVAQGYFMISMLIYPATALFILVPAFARVLFTSLDVWPKTRNRILRDVAFVVVGMLAYFVFVRCIYFPLTVLCWPVVGMRLDGFRGGIYEFAVSTDVRSWMRIAGDLVIVSVTGPLHAVVQDQTAVEVGRIIAGALLVMAAGRFIRMICKAGQVATRDRLSYACQASLACGALFLLSEAPVIISHANGFSVYRVLFPGMAMFVLLAFRIIPQWCELRLQPRGFAVGPIFSLLVLMICAHLSHRNLQNVVTNALIELNYLRQELATIDPQTVRSVKVICPVNRATFVERPLKKDFSMGATNHFFCGGIVDAVLEERGLHRGTMPVMSTHLDATSDTTITVEEGTRVIDMNRAIQSRGIVFRSPSFAVVSASTASSGAQCGALLAFDDDANTYWETTSFPQWLQFNCPKPWTITAYRITAGQVPDRVPEEWQLLGSDDCASWTVVHDCVSDHPWQVGEERCLQLGHPVQYRAYRLLFTRGPSDWARIQEFKLDRAPIPSIATSAMPARP